MHANQIVFTCPPATFSAAESIYVYLLKFIMMWQVCHAYTYMGGVKFLFIDSSSSDDDKK